MRYKYSLSLIAIALYLGGLLTRYMDGYVESYFWSYFGIVSFGGGAFIAGALIDDYNDTMRG